MVFWPYLFNQNQGGGGVLSLIDTILSFNPITYHPLAGPEPGVYTDLGSAGATLTNPAVDIAAVNTVPGDDGSNYPGFGFTKTGGAATQLHANTEISAANPHGNGGLTIGLFALADASTGVQQVLLYTGEAAIGTGFMNGSALGVSAIMPSVSNGLFGHNREVVGALSVSDWVFIICRFPDSITALPDVRINGVNQTGTTYNASNAVSASAELFYVAGRQGGSSGSYAGSLAHAFTIQGVLSDADCEAIENAARSDGWTI